MRASKLRKYQAVFFTAFSLAVFGGVPTLAAADENPSNQQATTLGAITVTAQKTEENLQDVPISISVFDDMVLEDREIKNLGDLANYVPNFAIAAMGDAGGSTAPMMRGMNTPLSTMASSVGLYVDGVPITSSIGFAALMNNVERVEVLRGPQGSLYGKNSEAGVINI